ncbi:LabA-like NYN domain-containing protein [Leptodesmis sichuanensis]|uniref:LabA-like NYN domain-containing protein n=2 Tax=Leptodesmis TaxID=2664261 RepID=UPI001F38107F|nr:NYN domain-containing protein [Leptodesmis sichuanensis]UIE36162.1 NYN domain-containing protein [Leptodesmis sichuanensis A121]
MQLIPKPERNGSSVGRPSNSGKSVEPSISGFVESPSYIPSSYQIDESPHDRVIVFIDGSNLFYAALNLGIEIDYTRLLQCLVRNRKLVRSYFYTGVDRTNEKQHGFLLWMSRNGYRVVSKELLQMPDGSKKANLDVEIAVDMLAMAGVYDTAVLVSGDGDLAYAANAVAYKGVQVEVVSLQSMTSDCLLQVADRYTDLASIQQAIAKS